MLAPLPSPVARRLRLQEDEEPSAVRKIPPLAAADVVRSGGHGRSGRLSTVDARTPAALGPAGTGGHGFRAGRGVELECRGSGYPTGLAGRDEGHGRVGAKSDSVDGGATSRWQASLRGFPRQCFVPAFGVRRRQAGSGRLFVRCQGVSGRGGSRAAPAATAAPQKRRMPRQSWPHGGCQDARRRHGARRHSRGGAATGATRYSGGDPRTGAFANRSPGASADQRGRTRDRRSFQSGRIGARPVSGRPGGQSRAPMVVRAGAFAEWTRGRFRKERRVRFRTGTVRVRQGRLEMKLPMFRTQARVLCNLSQSDRSQFSLSW